MRPIAHLFAAQLVYHTATAYALSNVARIFSPASTPTPTPVPSPSPDAFLSFQGTIIVAIIGGAVAIFVALITVIIPLLSARKQRKLGLSLTLRENKRG